VRQNLSEVLPSSPQVRLISALRKRELSAVELLDETVRAIEGSDAQINAIPVRDFDRAHDGAREADALLGRGDFKPLDLALEVLSGQDDLNGGLKNPLRLSRRSRLGDFRILLLDTHPLAAVDTAIRTTLNRLAEEIERLGATVERQWPKTIDLTESFRLYVAMLLASQARETYAEEELGVPPAPPPLSAHAWLDGLDAQQQLRCRWAEVFREWDIVLAPCFGTIAFQHMDFGNWNRRTLSIDGVPTPYGRQVAWPGIASLANLPATAIPVDISPDALPIGVQAIGPYLEDRTTIAFARLLGVEGMASAIRPIAAP
jgi:amidase